MNLRLEDITKPFKIMDDVFHRNISKVTKKWEERGHNRYSLSGIADAITFSSVFTI